MNRYLRKASMLLAIGALLALMTSPAQARFTSEKYPATVTGSSTQGVMDAFGSTVLCANTTFIGTLLTTAEDFTVTPAWGGCAAFGLPMTAKNNSCDYVFHKPDGKAGTMDVVCTKAGDAIEVTVYSSSSHTTALCRLSFPAQAAKSGYTLTNGTGENAGKVILGGTVTGVVAKMMHRTSISCPVGPEDSAVKYTVQAAGVVLSGNNGAISVD